jgi:hypothetical protein
MFHHRVQCFTIVCNVSPSCEMFHHRVKCFTIVWNVSPSCAMFLLGIYTVYIYGSGQPYKCFTIVCNVPIEYSHLCFLNIERFHARNNREKGNPCREKKKRIIMQTVTATPYVAECYPSCCSFHYDRLTFAGARFFHPKNPLSPLWHLAAPWTLSWKWWEHCRNYRTAVKFERVTCLISRPAFVITVFSTLPHPGIWAASVMPCSRKFKCKILTLIDIEYEFFHNWKRLSCLCCDIKHWPYWPGMVRRHSSKEPSSLLCSKIESNLP